MSPAAERMRRTRERRAKGLMPLSINVDEVALPALLVAAGFLASAAVDDRGAIRAALQRYLADVASPDAYEAVAPQRRELLVRGTKRS
jgi:hypothetical protein